MGTNHEKVSLSERLSDWAWTVLGSPKTLAVLLAALGLSWGVLRFVPQLPRHLGQEPRLASQWLAQHQASTGSWGAVLRFFGLFDVRHAFWFTMLWAALAASLSVGLADTVAQTAGWSGSRRPLLRRVRLSAAGRILFCAGALLALAGLYWGDQRGWSAQVSLLPGQSVAVGHGLPWALRFDGFEHPPASVGPGRDLKGRVSLLGAEGTAAADTPLSASHPFRCDNLSVVPVWFGKRVRIRATDSQGTSVPLEASPTGRFSDEAVLYFGEDGAREVRLSADWRLIVTVQLDDDAVLAQLSGPPAGAVVESMATPPATVFLGDFTFQVERETYATLELRYRPGRKLVWGGLGMAAIGLALLGLLWAVTTGDGSGSRAARPD